MMGSGGVGGVFGAHLEALRHDGLTIENEPQGDILAVHAAGAPR